MGGLGKIDKVSGIQMILFGTGMENHLNDADCLQLVFELTASVGVELYMLPGAAEFCTVLSTVISTNNGVHGEKLRLICLQ